jgi:hypothetical protein
LRFSYSFLFIKDKYLASIDEKNQIISDINALQICESPSIFLKAAELFKEKWNKKKDPLISKFIDYFDKQWLESLPNWYEGYATGLPSTNNALEAKNRVLKDEVTQYHRLDTGRFLPVFEEDLVKQ